MKLVLTPDIVTVQQMTKHVEDGLTDSQIAELYFVHPNTVYRYRSKYGIKKHLTKLVRNVEAYYRMKECKLTDEQVAYIWNTSRRSLSEWKVEEGLVGTALQKVDSYADGTPIFDVIVRKEREPNAV